MLNVVRRSQIVGLSTMDGSTATQYNTVEEVWLDEEGKVVYLKGSEGYTPLEQISVVGDDAVLTYSNETVRSPQNLRRIDRLEVSTPTSAPMGWVEDFLFDWESGDIAAYILGGAIAEPFGGTAVLFPDDVKVIDGEIIILEEGAKNRLKSEQEGLKGFVSEKSQQVKHLVKKMSDRLRNSISADDKAEAIKGKIKQVSNELAGSVDKKALAEATEFLQEKWQELQQTATSAGKRIKSAANAAWKELTHK